MTGCRSAPAGRGRGRLKLADLRAPEFGMHTRAQSTTASSTATTCNRSRASNAVDQRYVYGTSDHVTQGSTDLAYVADIRGSVRLVVDVATGAVLQRTDYSPFGIATGTAPVQPFGFDGGLVGADGAVRFGARDYDPATGRWRSKDPVGFNGGTADLFGFVVGNPVGRNDTSGQAGRAPAPKSNTERPPSPPPVCRQDHKVVAEWCSLSEDDCGNEVCVCDYTCNHCSDFTKIVRADDGCPGTWFTECEK